MLGVIDWGIGGIGVYRLIKNQLGLPALYFSDTGFTPYGKTKPGELRDRLERVIAFLEKNGATHILIACNAASTAIPSLRTSLPVLGMIGAGVEIASDARPKKLGLIGGRRTVLSGVYRKGFQGLGIKMHQRIAQPLSGMIETGNLRSPDLQREAAKILHPLRNCSHILLACTHYPAIETELKKYVSANTKFIDPAERMVEKVAELKLEKGGKSRFVTTGSASQMQLSGIAAFGFKMDHAETVSV